MRFLGANNVCYDTCASIVAYAWLPRIVYGCGHVLHSALCFFQSPFWHLREQYRACMHLWQRFNLTPIDARAPVPP